MKNRPSTAENTVSHLLSLADLAPGQTGIVSAVHNAESMRRRLLDLGLTKHTPVRCLGRSPAGDPSAYLIRGAVIALRNKDCRDILIDRSNGKDAAWD